MARTNLPLSNLIAEASVATGTYAGFADPAGTAIDQANGMNVVLATTAIPHVPGGEGLVLRVANSAAGAHIVTLRAGAYPPAFEQMKGDQTVSVGATSTKWIGPLEYARHAQADGSLNIDFDAGTTGTITAFLVPIE